MLISMIDKLIDENLKAARWTFESNKKPINEMENVTQNDGLRFMFQSEKKKTPAYRGETRLPEERKYREKNYTTTSLKKSPRVGWRGSC